MPEPLFHAPGSGHGSALEQLTRLRDLARRAPAAETAAAAVDAAPVEAFAAVAEGPAAQTADNLAANVATEFVDAAPEAAAVAAAPEAATTAAAPRQGLRSMTVADIGDLFRRAAVAPNADAAAPVLADAAEAVARPSLADQLRAAAAGARGQAAPAIADAAAPVVAEAAEAAVRPSLLDQLRSAAGQLRGPAATGAAEFAAEAPRAAGGAKGLAAIREGLSGLGALRGNAAAREVVEEAVEHAPSLADRALDALKVASKVNPRG